MEYYVELAEEALSDQISEAHSEVVVFKNCPRTFDGIKEWIAEINIEGVVFHHPDGRMAKIKKRDFGIIRHRDR